jgi:hypothetical protein
MKKRLPTDLKILSTIYDRYEDDFVYTREARENLILVPIDIEVVASSLNIDPYLLFGRLYHDLDRKFGYVTSSKGDTTTRVCLFAPVAGQNKNCVNFPLLAGVVAGMQDQDRKQRQALRFSIIALCVSSGLALLRLVGLS